MGRLGWLVLALSITLSSGEQNPTLYLYRAQAKAELQNVGDAAADDLLNTDGTALLVGMLLDQQVPMEWAFTGPATLRERLGHLDAAKIAAMGEDEFVEVCAQKPAIHRFPGSMAARVQALVISAATASAASTRTPVLVVVMGPSTQRDRKYFVSAPSAPRPPTTWPT